MTRIALDLYIKRMNAAYRDDPFHAFRRNVDNVRPEEWNVAPANWSVDEFGTHPELTICDLVLHVAGAKFMYADRAFGDAILEWGSFGPPGTDMQSALAWLEEGQGKLVAGLAALTNDSELTIERPAPWRIPMPREQLLNIVINHDLYHSGEVNRQRSLLRGADGWHR